MRLFLCWVALVVLIGLVGRSCGRAIEQEQRPTGLSAAQRLEVMSRINEPCMVIADEQNLSAYDRHLTRSVEEDWRARQ